MEMSLDQFEEAKEANQKWKYGNERASESWRKVKATAIWEQACKKIESRVLIDKGAVMIVHVLSGWLASSYPIRRAFLQHISWRVSVESVINKRKSSCHFHCISHEGMARLLYGCLFILPNTAVILDLKAFLSIKNYFYQHQNITIIIRGESETCPNFWNRHNNSLSKVYRFIWSCRVFVYYWTCFSRLAALVCFLAVVPFVIFRILLQQLQEKNEQPKIFSSLRAQCETLRVDWRLRG